MDLQYSIHCFLYSTITQTQFTAEISEQLCFSYFLCHVLSLSRQTIHTFYASVIIEWMSDLSDTVIA